MDGIYNDADACPGFKIIVLKKKVPICRTFSFLFPRSHFLFFIIRIGNISC